MGTDVYLYWDGKTKAEQDAQYTGYSIDAGNAGYLRASIGMETENAALRELFPPKVWKPKDDDGVAYDFDQGFTDLLKVARKYLVSVIFGVPFEKNTAQVEYESQVKKMSAILSGNFDEIVIKHSNDLPSAVMWLNSLFQFFWLGMEKQKKKLNPKVYISW